MKTLYKVCGMEEQDRLGSEGLLKLAEGRYIPLSKAKYRINWDSAGSEFRFLPIEEQTLIQDGRLKIEELLPFVHKIGYDKFFRINIEVNENLWIAKSHFWTRLLDPVKLKGKHQGHYELNNKNQ